MALYYSCGLLYGTKGKHYAYYLAFEVKNFLEFFCLQSTLDSKFFRGDVQTTTFFGHAKFEVINFRNFFLYHVL